MTKELPQNPKRGELILISPYKDCSYMVLAEYGEPSAEGNDAFHAERADILEPLTPTGIVPHAHRDLEKANSNPDIKGEIIGYNVFKSRYELRLSPFKDSRFWIGIENVLQILRETNGYEPHASSLEASLRMRII